MTDAERRAALEGIAAEIRACTRCRLHEQRTKSVPGEGNPSTEVVFVGEGPGFNEDRQGRPFVGRAGDLLVRLLGSIGWRREDVFITNVVKCRPPENRDPEPDEIAMCFPYLKRQLEVLDPALVVTLGRHSMGRFMPGTKISQSHGTVRPVDPETGAADALVLAMYHPAAALRTPQIERESYQDVARVPFALLDARRRREERGDPPGQTVPERAAAPKPPAAPELAAVPESTVVAESTVVPESTATPELTAMPGSASNAPLAAAATPTDDLVRLASSSVATLEKPTTPLDAAARPMPPVDADPTDQLTLF